MTETIVSISGVTVSYGSVLALDAVDLELPAVDHRVGDDLSKVPDLQAHDLDLTPGQQLAGAVHHLLPDMLLRGLGQRGTQALQVLGAAVRRQRITRVRPARG